MRLICVLLISMVTFIGCDEEQDLIAPVFDDILNLNEQDIAASLLIDFEAEAAAIQEAYSDFYKAFNANDIEAIRETFDNEVTFGTIFSGNEPVPLAFGWPNVKAAIEGLWIGIGTKGAKWGPNDQLTDLWIFSNRGTLEAAAIGYNCYKGPFPGETHLYLVKEEQDGWQIHELDSITENNLILFGSDQGEPRLKKFKAVTEVEVVE